MAEALFLVTKASADGPEKTLVDKIYGVVINKDDAQTNQQIIDDVVAQCRVGGHPVRANYFDTVVNISNLAAGPLADNKDCFIFCREGRRRSKGKLATITRVATSTIVDGWPVKVPNVAAHLNVGAGVDTPNVATYVQAGEAGWIVEYGGFDFSAIPVGSSINSIEVRQYMRGSGQIQSPGVRFGLQIGNAERVFAGFSVDTDGNDVVATAMFPSTGGITRNELATPNLFSVEKNTSGNPVDPPIPQG